MITHHPLHRFIPRKFLIAAACSGIAGFGIPYTAQAEITHYSSTFTIIHQQMSGTTVPPTQIASGDAYEIQFALDNSVLADNSGTFTGLVTSFSLTALPGNTGSFPAGNFTLASNNRVVFYSGGFMVLRFEFSEGPEISFNGTPSTPPFTPTSTTGELSYLQFYFTGAGSSVPAMGTPFSSVEDYLLTATPDSGNSVILFTSSTLPGARAAFNGSFTQPTITTIPEPGTYALLGTAAAALLFLRKRKK